MPPSQQGSCVGTPSVGSELLESSNDLLEQVDFLTVSIHVFLPIEVLPDGRVHTESPFR
jgi:hypothetical protein